MVRHICVCWVAGLIWYRPQGIKIVGIGMDGQGMRADLLDQRLSNWNGKEGRKPKVAYIVPYIPPVPDPYSLPSDPFPMTVVSEMKTSLVC